MIIQTATGLNSRSEANPYNEDGFLPLITAPMYSVVDETNYQMFLENGIQVCLPRQNGTQLSYNNEFFVAISLSEFIENFVTKKYRRDLSKIHEQGFNHIKVCIDTANGNMPKLHNAIKKAKEIHGDNLTIMAGNVASVDAFIELAKTNCDYIRVGIGGGGGCNTTANTGVGQMNLQQLISACNRERIELFPSVKIIADGISSYVEDCRTLYNYNDNGYAAINKLLFAGADLVMIGKLFAQCVESAGEKKDDLVKYSGMSTREAQEQYQPYLQNVVSTGKRGVKLEDDTWEFEVVKHGDSYQSIKPSEGSVNWIPVRWTLKEWLYGSENQDKNPYLMGWINSIKSAMAYTNKKVL
jgi:IMP dehydrogenase/GMP reductase